MVGKIILLGTCLTAAKLFFFQTFSEYQLATWSGAKLAWRLNLPVNLLAINTGT